MTNDCKTTSTKFAFLDVTKLDIYHLEENGEHIDHDRRRKVRTVKLATLFFYLCLEH